MKLNDRGFIAMDYIFAMVIVMGFAGILFALSLTFTTIEITQYITFASARNYYAAHISEKTQKEMATEKYLQLSQNNEVFAALFRGGWFEITVEPSYIGNHASREAAGSINEPYPYNRKNLFFGVSAHFKAKILDFNIPFLGSTSKRGDGSGDGFQTYIGSYLGKDVSQKECVNFMNQRWQNLLNQPGTNYKTIGINQIPSVMDNGC